MIYGISLIHVSGHKGKWTKKKKIAKLFKDDVSFFYFFIKDYQYDEMSYHRVVFRLFLDYSWLKCLLLYDRQSTINIYLSYNTFILLCMIILTIMLIWETMSIAKYKFASTLVC